MTTARLTIWTTKPLPTQKPPEGGSRAKPWLMYIPVPEVLWSRLLIPSNASTYEGVLTAKKSAAGCQGCGPGACAGNFFGFFAGFLREPGAVAAYGGGVERAWLGGPGRSAEVFVESH